VFYKNRKNMNSKLMKVGALGVFFFMASQVQAQKTDTKPKTEKETVIEDVVLVGYKTQKKSTNTSSASTVSDAQLKDQNTSNIGDMLQGKAAGLSVNVSGNPDENAGINIRGFASLYGSTGPLWVIDGVIIGNVQPNSLDPNQIESVTVLKDAASTALYGSTGANGVIVVTTKQGKKNSSNLSFSVSSSFSTPNLGNFKLKDSQQLLKDYDVMYRKYMNTKQLTDPSLDFDAITNPYILPTQAPNWYTGRPQGNLNNYNWFDNAFQTGVTNNYNVSYSAGTDKSKTFISLGYIAEDYIIKGNKKDSYFFRLNHDYEVTKSITLKPKVSIGYYDYNTIKGGDVYSAYIYMPWDSPYGANGAVLDAQTDLTQTWYTRERSNPYYDVQWNTTKRNEWDLLGAFEAEVKLFSNLKFVSNNSINRINFTKQTYLDPKSNAGKAFGGRLIDETRNTTTLFTNQMLKFDDKFGNHNINALLAYEFRENKYDPRIYNNNNLISGKTALEILGSASKSKGIPVEKARQSILFNAEYDYANKYFVQVSARRDGSSQFGVSTNKTKKNMYGNFYAISGGWNIHKEDFLKNQKVLTELKLRASYGKVGNLPKEAYNHFTYYGLGTNYNNSPGGVLDNVAYDEYTWETTKQTNLGLNVAFLNRFRLSADVYRNLTDGLLTFIQLPETSGQTKQLRNAGSLKNEGVELVLSADIIKTQNYKWTVDANWSKNTNRLLSFNFGKPNFDDGIYAQEGLDASSYALREWAGVNPNNGAPQWYTNTKDSNGNLVKDITSNANNANIIPISASTPDFTAGINSNLKIYDFTLNINAYGVFGGKILNSPRALYDSDGAYPKYNQMEMPEGSVRWEKPGDVATHPAMIYANPSFSNGVTSRYLEDQTFIKIRSIRLGYDVPKQYLDAIYAKSLNVFISAENVHTFSKFSGVTPEVGVSDSPSKNKPGFAGTVYPNPRRFTLGLNINF
jgi:TonB-linked SusC/RagA family outer membrane protein